MNHQTFERTWCFQTPSGSTFLRVELPPLLGAATALFVRRGAGRSRRTWPLRARAGFPSRDAPRARASVEVGRRSRRSRAPLSRPSFEGRCAAPPPVVLGRARAGHGRWRCAARFTRLLSRRGRGRFERVRWFCAASSPGARWGPCCVSFSPLVGGGGRQGARARVRAPGRAGLTSWSSPSNGVRLPAELKHITKRRKRN